MSRPTVVVCNFRFELRPENETVELVSGHHTARVCKECLELLAVHRRIHKMRIEQIIPLLSEHRPLVTHA